MKTSYNPTSFDKLPKLIKAFFAGREHRLRFDLDDLSEAMILPNGHQVFPVRTPQLQKKFGSLEMLIHEMAHFIEIDEPRMHQSNFGLGSFLTMGKAESLWDAMRHREIRVLAIVMSILERLDPLPSDLEIFLESEMHSVTYMSRGMRGEVHWETQRRNEFISDVEQEFKEMRARQDFTFDSIEREWFRRMKIVDEIETRENLHIVMERQRLPRILQDLESVVTVEDPRGVIYVGIASVERSERFAAAAVLVRDGKVVEQMAGKIRAKQPELVNYHAFFMALHLANKHGIDGAIIHTESVLVARQVRHNLLSKDKDLGPLQYAMLKEEGQKFIDSSVSVQIRIMPKHEIGPGHALAWDTLDELTKPNAIHDAGNPSQPMKYMT